MRSGCENLSQSHCLRALLRSPVKRGEQYFLRRIIGRIKSNGAEPGAHSMFGNEPRLLPFSPTISILLNASARNPPGRPHLQCHRSVHSHPTCAQMTSDGAGLATVNVPRWLFPPRGLGLVSFHLGLQEALSQCLLGGNAAGTVTVFLGTLGTEVGRTFADLAFCLVCSPPVSSPSPQEGNSRFWAGRFPQSFHVWAQTAWGQIPALCHLGQVTALLCASVSSPMQRG